MSDLELSERVVADILSTLLDRGLLGLDIEQIGQVTEIEVEAGDFLNIMKWLEREGLIYFHLVDLSSHQGRSGYYLQSSLTAYGFAVMGHQFGANENLTIGQVAKKIASNDLSWKIGEFVGGLGGGFTKSISS